MTDILDAILDGSGSGGSSDLDPIAQATQTYFSTDFEINSGSFTLGGLWHRSTACSTLISPTAHTTTGSLHAGVTVSCDYLSVTNRTDTADSPAIDLTAASVPAALTFNYFLDTDGSGSDFARVRVSTDAGSTFTTVADNAGSPVLLTDDGTWRSAIVSLSTFVGSTIIIRFEFEMDGTAGVVAGADEGFYVDDIVVTADDGVAAGGSGSGGAGPCFIATAAYGTPLAQDINALRGVRDTYLLNNVLGAAFVDTYYRTSPVVADWVSRYPMVASGVRLVLAPVVALSRLALNAPLALTVLLLGAGVAALRIRTRKDTGTA